MTTAKETINELLDRVSDPEIPVLTVRDLGIIREVNIGEHNSIEVVITPTYSGCPAMNTIEVNIRAVLQEAGYEKVKVKTVLRPAWTTAWISEEGRKKLREYGIAPPEEDTADKGALFPEDKKVTCPHCGSRDTKMISQFGSTPCKSQYQCKSCLEPFDYFKCH
ncbi:MAG: 1,2-phenylacetyl-CoA epoxidase subunit PaaD [Saprospiraceae bacterium]|nr:1,2-phenylacetyl-CoA epoxidase subunit PaaD [Saprospiraceae bacterium]